MFFLQHLQNAFAGIFQLFTIPNVKADSKMVNLPTLHSCTYIEHNASLEVMSEGCAMRTSTAEQSSLQDPRGNIYDDYRETTCTFFKE